MAASGEEENGAKQEFSKGDLRRQLYASLRSTGVLDSMKGQLRARLLEHLRRHKEGLLQLEKQKQRKPSVTERLLSSLFLDYLNCNRFAFTVSVFVPESQMSSWPPLSHQEMLALLHLQDDSSSASSPCLAYQLVQQMTHRSSSSIKEVSTQTSPGEACKRGTQTSSKQLERSLKEVEDAYIRKKDAQRSLQDRSLEDNLSVLHQEFDARVNTEVALQVCRMRDHEINAARMDEAARYRRQLARDREELEEIHKSRMDRIKAREEALLERVMSREKAVEASAYEQRQRILREITSLRERESKLRQWKESQERREEKLDEREMALRALKEDVEVERKALLAQADEIAASRRKELEVQYRELCDRLHQDQTLLAAEWEQLKEERVAVSIEQATSRSDKELIQALHRRLSAGEDERVKLEICIRELEEKLKLQQTNIPDYQRLEEQLRESHAELEKERVQREASEKEKKTLERKVQQKKVELAAARRSPQGEWITEHKSLMATIYKQEAELQQKETQLQLMESEKEKLTERHMKLLLKIDHLDTLVKKAQEEKDHLVRNLEILQVQQTTNERELLDTTTLLRKAQQALEAERLEHCALRSHLNAATPATRNDLTTDFQDKIERKSCGSVEYESSVVAVSTSVKESVDEKSKPEEAHELWTRLLSNNAAKRASLDLERSHFLTLESGKGEEENISNSNDGFASKVQFNRSEEVYISEKNNPILSWSRSEVTAWGGNITEECEKELLLVPSSSLIQDDAADRITQDVETQKGNAGTWNSNEGEQQEKRHSEADGEYVKHHDLESLQSRDETHMGSSQMDSHYSQSDHIIPQVMAEVLIRPQIHEGTKKIETECQTLDQTPGEESKKIEAECQTLDQPPGEDSKKNEAECQTLDQTPGEESKKIEAECQTLDQPPGEEIKKNEAECQTLDQSPPAEINKNEAECQTLDQSPAEINKNEAECRTSPAEIAGYELEVELQELEGQLMNLTEEDGNNTDPLICKENQEDGRKMSGLPDAPPGAHALEALRSSIVIRKQDESSSSSTIPTLALAITNNQLVEVGKGAEEEDERGNPEAKASVDPEAPHSSGEDSAYNYSDSFEEDEEEEDQQDSSRVRMLMTGSRSEQGSHSPQGDEHK